MTTTRRICVCKSVFGILIKYGDFYGFEFETHFGFMPQHGFSSYSVAFNNHVMLFIIIFVSVFIFYSVPCVPSLSLSLPPSFSGRFGRLNLQVINTTQFCKITMLNDPKLPEIVFHIEYFWRVILSLDSQVKCFMHDLIQPNRRKKTHSSRNKKCFYCKFVRHLQFDCDKQGNFYFWWSFWCFNLAYNILNMTLFFGHVKLLDKHGEY